MDSANGGRPVKAPYAWIDKEGNSAPQEQPCAEHTFLFVNESTARGGFKAGRRPAVRSHIRKHVMRQSRKAQEESGQRDTPKYGYSAIAPSENCKQKAAELSTETHAFTLIAPGIQQSEPITAEATIDEELANQYTTQGCNSTNFVNKFNWPDESVSSILDPPPSHISTGNVQPIYCLHCGATQDFSQTTDYLRREERSLVKRPSERGNIFESVNPLQILGAGRVDPFLSYPGEASNGSTKELMDHTITYLLPGLVPDGGNEPVNPVSKAWFSSAMTLPLLFHALVFAGAIHLDYMRRSAIDPNSKVALSHKLAVIQQLNMVLANPKEAQRDEVILAILILASHEAREQTENKAKPFNSPLKSAQWLDVYGNIQYVPEHMKAVMELIAMKGGIENLKLHGLAETIVCGDIIEATNNLSKPSLPPLKRLTEWIEYVINWATASSRFPVQILGRGFIDLQPYGLTPDAIYAFHAMGSTTAAIDTHLQGMPAGLTIGQISMVRTAVHQRLLLLQPVDELTERTPLHPNIYEACRTSALIYSIAVIYPIPNTSQLFHKLVARLKVCIETEQLSREPALSDPLLWMLIVGGIAALDNPERMWYVSQVVDYVKRWNIHEWSGVEKVLGSFLWLDSACGQGGRTLWNEVMDRL